jgi:hypothetical protein
MHLHQLFDNPVIRPYALTGVNEMAAHGQKTVTIISI